MTSAKEQMKEIIQEQPDDSSYDEILRELAFIRMVERGLEDSIADRTISDKEIRAQNQNMAEINGSAEAESVEAE